MALAREAVAVKSDEDFGTTAASLTGFNLDCGTTGNRVAFVGVMWNRDFNHTITGITIGGNAMTALAAHFQFVARGQWFEYIAPGTGNQSVVVSHDGGTGGGARDVLIVAVSYSGAHQTDPSSGYATASGTSTNLDLTVASQTGDEVLVLGGAYINVTYTTDDAGATELADAYSGSAGGISHMVSARPGAASVATEHTPSSSAQWTALGFSVVPAAAAATSGAGVNRGLEAPPATRSAIVGAMKRMGNLFVPYHTIYRPRLVPVGISL